MPKAIAAAGGQPDKQTKFAARLKNIDYEVLS